jgi:hypothetical protein
VWFQSCPWAILCSPTHATLVMTDSLENIREQKDRNDDVVNYLRTLFNSTPINLHESLDEFFFDRVISHR